jgi:conjugative relaxase-like TrwC/TraI family protein
LSAAPTVASGDGRRDLIVLGLHRIANTGADYYLADLARELPVATTGRSGRAQWCGRAAAGLGLVGALDPEGFRAVLDGRHPASDRRLRSDRAVVGAYDLTFSAPKSVSVLFGLGGADQAHQVLAAHHDAVNGALTYMEAHGLSARRGSGERREVVPTSGLVAGSFTHGLNRNLDPHLHSHVVVANLVHGEDGRWSACDQRGLWAHAPAAGAVYESHLRAQLSRQLGVTWSERPDQRTEVAGISPLLLGEFSSRSADIRRHMAEWGSRSARGSRVAWAATRDPKQGDATFRELTVDWERRARAVGVPSLDLVPHVARADVVARPTLHEHRFRATLSRTADGAARRRDVVTGLGVAAVPGATAPTLERLTDLWLPPSREVGVAEPAHAPRGLVPGDHLLAALGPRPVEVNDHRVWQAGAQAIEAYRRQWGVTRSADALGAGPECRLSAFPAARLADHVRTERTVEVTRQQLGWRPPQVLEMDRGR